MQAITRQPGDLSRCELTHLGREAIDMRRARAQHAAYEDALRELGVRVISLPAEPQLPDSVFVEDTVVVLPELAIIPHMGAASRRPETYGIAEALEPYRRVEWLEPHGTLDGGDVLRVGRTLYVGSSSRTTAAGIDSLRHAVAPWDYRVRPLEVRGCLHLKSACSLVTDDTVILNPDWVDRSGFVELHSIAVPRREPRAANTLRIGDNVLVSAAFPRTAALLRAQGLDVRTLDQSELMKAEGGLTCSSVLFD